MVYLPNDLNMLRERLTKMRDDFDKAKKRFDHFISVQKSELYDKFVAEPIDEAKALNKTKEEVDEIKRLGLIKYNAEFEKDRIKKGRELKLKEFTKEIKSIKQRMLEIDPNSLNEDSMQKIVTPKAQSRFELNF